MGSQAGGSSSHLNIDSKEALKNDLLKEGHTYSFFQVIRLLRFIISESTKVSMSGSSPDEAIRIRPNLSLAFSASDVESVQELDNDETSRFLVTTNFLGLYGSSSPLPVFYTEDLIDEESADESVSRDFIDIINQRLFSLLFECWTKYRQYLQVVEQENSAYIDRLFCLLGLGGKGFREEIPEPNMLFRYIGLLSQFPHSGVGLKTLLKDAISGIALDVIPCVERTAKIPDDQKLRLGISGCKLGIDSFIGDMVNDRMGKFRIRIGPLSRADFKRLSPGTKAFKRLSSLTDFYFVEPLDYDMELIMAKGEAQTLCLGDPKRASLGVDSWIFSSRELGEVKVLFNPRNYI